MQPIRGESLYSSNSTFSIRPTALEFNPDIPFPTKETADVQGLSSDEYTSLQETREQIQVTKISNSNFSQPPNSKNFLPRSSFLINL